MIPRLYVCESLSVCMFVDMCRFKCWFVHGCASVFWCVRHCDCVCVCVHVHTSVCTVICMFVCLGVFESKVILLDTCHFVSLVNQLSQTKCVSVSLCLYIYLLDTLSKPTYLHHLYLPTCPVPHFFPTYPVPPFFTYIPRPTFPTHTYTQTAPIQQGPKQ